jgi:hypothetical protein
MGKSPTCCFCWSKQINITIAFEDADKKLHPKRRLDELYHAPCNVRCFGVLRE